MRTIRDSAGWYTVRDRDLSVTIRFFPHLKGWIAQADFSRFVLSDPVPTKREAVASARYMIETQRAGGYR